MNRGRSAKMKLRHVVYLPTLAAITLWFSHSFQRRFFPPRSPTSSDDFLTLRDTTVMQFLPFWMLPAAVLAILLLFRVRSASAFFLACSVAVPAVGWMSAYLIFGIETDRASVSILASSFISPGLAISGCLAHWMDRKNH